MNIALDAPVEKYVLVKENTGEFYCGRKYFSDSILDASMWDTKAELKHGVIMTT